MVVTVLLIYLLQGCGVKIDQFEMSKLLPYSIYVVAFVLAIYTNMMALNYSNIETVIVFRSCTPISVSIVEYLFMGRDLPSLRSCLVSINHILVDMLVLDHLVVVVVVFFRV